MIRKKIAALRTSCAPDRLKQKVRKLTRFLFNPRLLLCLFIAWMITNGWSYVFLGLGIVLKLNWMRIVGVTYMSLLWLPFTPEKLLTLLIAIGLLRLLFPHDRRTLAVLREKLHTLRSMMGRKAAQ